ncbi:MAG: CehA/McbA family metallohydrolase [bacterium]|nr:CehA/McbA family metallohydrolase [bacterium]
MYLNPYTDSRRWLRGNLHGHTCCGRFMDVSESGPMYASLGYDFMAITDHNMAPSEAQWRTWQSQANLVLIPGEENGSTDHILELGVFAVTDTPSDNMVERTAVLKKSGGFIAACHPQQYDHGAENIHAAANILHAFEIYNGLRENRGCDEAANIAIWDDVLTKGHRIWGVATDDFHCQYTTPGKGWVCVQVPEEDKTITWQTLVQQLKKGAFYASTSPSFDHIVFDGQTLRVKCDSFVQKIRIVGPEGRTVFQIEGNRLEWAAEPDLTYFRIEGHCGVRRTWSQPFFKA